MDESLRVRYQILVASALCMVPQAQGKWWLISKIKQPWRKNIRQLKIVRKMDYRGIKHPRHAGLPARLPVNSNQARKSKNCTKIAIAAPSVT